MESVERYLEDLASSRPVPGGGSAAAVVGACGAALAAMVARICSGNPKYSSHGALLERIVAEADDVRLEFLAARERDERAFSAVTQAQALPKGTQPERDARRRALDDALMQAAHEPLHAAALGLRVLQMARNLSAVGNRSLASDVGCAAEFANAAVAACAYNVRVNHRYLSEPPSAAEQQATLERYERDAALLLSDVRAQIGD